MDMTYFIHRLLRIILDLIIKLLALFMPSHQRYLPAITDRLLLEPAVNLVKRIKSGHLKSEDLINAYINRIKLIQPHVNAVADQCYENAIKAAIEVDKRVRHELDGNSPLTGVSIHTQPLLGIPFSGKDGISIKGMKSVCGLVARKDIVADEDATVVTNLKAAGAIPICTTNVPELMMWWHTRNKVFGQSYNPYDKSIVTGGSTGGNGVLISSVGSVLGIASDIGGSTRIPAFFNGVFGHFTTPEVGVMDGHWPPFVADRLKMLSYGPMVRYASDIKPALKVFIGNDVSKLKLDETVDLSKLKVYYMYEIPDPDMTPVSNETRRTLDDCLRHLKSLGAVTEELKLDKFKHSFNIWFACMKTKGVPLFSEELTNRNGRINPYIEIIKSIFGGSNHTIESLVVAAIEGNTPSDEELQKYQKMAVELTTELHQSLGDNGVLLCPTHPDSYVKTNSTLLCFKNVMYTGIFNCLRVCATQIPLGLGSNGVPLGIQVIAKGLNDHLTISVAEEFERRFGGWVPPTSVHIM
ncbi:fatty-acid amide hydrolase 2-like [Oppia nitens]|uniref:fatty-acid amide hydrolase 2-like n=1 Tax=Oppia nitens TaxID=1686743 RepID=UPI0023DB6E52|nr:fatty-acid amide hydrolase 2-like [Oppia nitens]